MRGNFGWRAGPRSYYLFRLGLRTIAAGRPPEILRALVSAAAKLSMENLSSGAARRTSPSGVLMQHMPYASHVVR